MQWTKQSMQNEQRKDGPTTLKIVLQPVNAAGDICDDEHYHIEADLAHVLQLALVLLSYQLVALHGACLTHDGDYLDTHGNVHGQVVQENQRVEQVIEEELQAWVFARNPTPQSRVAESMTFRKRYQQ